MADEATAAPDESRAVPAPDEGRGDLLALLDEEMGRLPGRYRDPELSDVCRPSLHRRPGIKRPVNSSTMTT